MKTILALALYFSLLSLSTKADTVDFTFDNNSLTSPEIVSFNLQQGQTPDQVNVCGCFHTPLTPVDMDEILYFNVPMTINGVAGTGTAEFCDLCSFYDLASAGNIAAGDITLSNVNVYAVSLSGPQFIFGSFQGACLAIGCIPSDQPTLTITDTPEDSTLVLVLLGFPIIFAAKRQANRKGRAFGPEATLLSTQ
jgi:hypothetical protein